jgi:hypothetical protein
MSFPFGLNPTIWLKITGRIFICIFWHTAPSIPLEVNRWFGEEYRLHLQDGISPAENQRELAQCLLLNHGYSSWKSTKLYGETSQKNNLYNPIILWNFSPPMETHHISATDANCLMLCGETVAVCCENRTEHTDTLWAVRTSQGTHHVSATEPNQLMLWEQHGTQIHYTRKVSLSAISYEDKIIEVFTPVSIMSTVFENVTPCSIWVVYLSTLSLSHTTQCRILPDNLQELLNETATRRNIPEDDIKSYIALTGWTL